MEAKNTVQQAPPETQSELSELASGMRRMAEVLRGLLDHGDADDGDADEPHWSESVEWQDYLAYHDDKGVL